MGIVQRSGKRILVTGNRYQMHVVRHERVGANADPVL